MSTHGPPLLGVERGESVPGFATYTRKIARDVEHRPFSRET
jgi:hypothetical protein